MAACSEIYQTIPYPKIMNKSKALKLSSAQEDPSLPVLDTTSGQEENTAAATQSLFLAWSNSNRAENGQANGATKRKFSGDRSDTGFWLFHNRTTRLGDWAQLDDLGFGSRSLDEFSQPWYPAMKRATDTVISLALLILLLPLFALTVAAVKLDSSGPAFFRQRRIGKDGRVFLMWKFRSMCTGTPRYAASPASNRDARLTRVGRLIRRVSVDELPQLINVLRGEMSLVGPRPEMPFIVDSYTAVERERLAVKPGITGLWQVSPARARPIHENLQYDLHYIRNRNLVLDGVILIRTIAAVIRGVGAV
jgi:lipopolysaccharide/colanic/teichoic acid biosynthesis glycosyltransferase